MRTSDNGLVTIDDDAAAANDAGVGLRFESSSMVASISRSVLTIAASNH